MKCSHFVRKIRFLAFFVCLCAAYMCTFSSAHAASALLESGRSGSCTWKYEQIDGDTVLTIAPTRGTKGTLGSFSWRGFWYRETTKRVVVKGTVKVGPSASQMFKDFKRATSIDVAGLDVGGVTNMWDMFSDCHALTSLDVSNWNVSSVTNMGYMFYGCKALTSLDISKWNVSNVTYMQDMFYGCEALTSLDVSNWNVSKATDIDGMFFDCSALTSLDLSNWKVSDQVEMTWMFVNTQSLKQISLGSNFHIKDDAAFNAAGSSVGTNWMQVNLGKGGTYENPKGKVFGSSYGLLAFHRDRTKRETDKEHYVRVAVGQLTINFNKGANDATGGMTPQVYGARETKKLTKNAYKRAGFTFSGWKDSEGNVYADEQSFENNYYEKAAQNGKTPQKTLELIAQWKAILTYKVKEGTRIVLSRTQEEVDSGVDPLGCEVVAGIPYGKEVMWTVQVGGTDAASVWSHKGAKLGKDEIKAAALKDGKLVAITFIAELVDKTYTITFDANVPSGTEVKGLPKPIVVKHGEKSQIPFGITLSRPGYKFKGEWNTDKDGKGASYKAGRKIRNVFSHMTLYAQWEEIATLTYDVKEGTGLSLSRAQEELSPISDPLGTKVTTYVPYGKEIIWTVQLGGADAASVWSHKGAKLDKDAIKAAALKDGKLVSTTFVAELVDKTYTITFDANAPSGTDVKGLPEPIVVKHGQESQVPLGITLSRPGYKFTGEWNDDKDGNGASYKAGSKIENVFSPIILYAQWEEAITLTYNVKEDAQASLSLSHNLEELGISGNPLGSEVTTDVPYEKEVLWTVQVGGNEYASRWSHKGTKLGKDEIKAAALKDGKLTSTTFIAELVDKTYTITFDANVPSGTKVEGLPDPITVKHGQESQVPLDITLSRPGYGFTGEWNDDKDGEGASYKAGSKIENVFSDIILYAQWEKMTVLTYEVKEGTKLSLTRSQEELDLTSDPLGSEVIAGVPYDKEVLWTVQAGGADSASDWSYKGAKLEKAEIEKAALKDGKLVSTTFIAELVDKTYTITFDANVPSGTDVKGLPGLIPVKHGKSAQIPSSVLTRPGYKFKGEWNTDKDGNGASYKVGSKIENVFSPIILYAQWEKAITLTYNVKEDAQAPLSLSHNLEELAASGDPLGSEVTTYIPYGKEVMWTVQAGGNEHASCWSYQGAKLCKSAINAAALKDEKLVSTTFVAELVDKTYTITFDANVPSGTDVKGLPDPIVVKHGQESQVPLGITLSRPGYRFTGEWNDDKDGEGASYKAGSKIENVFSPITLYAQWEKMTVLTYEVKEGTKLSLTCSQEELDLDLDPLGSEVIEGVPYDKEVLWTVQTGGADSASDWSHKGAKLEKAEIEKAASKDGKLVSTTFIAELIDKTYTITFEVNAPSEAKVQGLPSPIPVKHGKSTQVPYGITLSCPGYRFTGVWNDDKDGNGASYKAGSKIENVFTSIILYAQWEKITASTDEADECQAIFSCTPKEIDTSDDHRECKATVCL